MSQDEAGTGRLVANGSVRMLPRTVLSARPFVQQKSGLWGRGKTWI